MKFSKNHIAAFAICLCASQADAGGLAQPITEAPVETPEETFEPAQGSVNGGYIMLGGFLLMALATAAGS